MPAQFTYHRRIQFAETDMAGIVHFSNYYRYMEEAEHAFFRSIGLQIMDVKPDGSFIGWPRVRSTCSYESPAHYQDEVAIGVSIQRRGVKSLTLAFHFYRDADLLAVGELKTVLCQKVAGARMVSIVIPDEMAAKLVEHPVENPRKSAAG